MTASTRALALAAGALVLVGVAGCAGSGAASPITSAPVPTTSAPTTVRPPTWSSATATAVPRSSSSTATRSTPSSPTISGYVIDGRTGAPMPGVIVEFKNLYGENVHTYTAANGSYSVRVPPDVYRALALADDPDAPIGFQVLGGGDNTVSVPPSARVDFESYTYG